MLKREVGETGSESSNIKEQKKVKMKLFEQFKVFLNVNSHGDRTERRYIILRKISNTVSTRKYVQD